MVDFRRLNKINLAVREAIAEEEKHRGPLSAEERRVADVFFHKGSMWERKQSEVIIHENQWWWGKSYTIITHGGKGTVTLSIENDRPDVGGITALMVMESEQKKGIGTEIMRLVEELARKNGQEQIYLAARKDTFLIPWYQKLGFEIYDENPKGQEEFTVAMKKVL